MKYKEIKQVLSVADLILEKTTPEIILWKFDEKILSVAKEVLKFLKNKEFKTSLKNKEALK